MNPGLNYGRTLAVAVIFGAVFLWLAVRVFDRRDVK